MICSKCTHLYQTNPRIRCTPTFFHHPIFDDFALVQRKITRCSATYHSTAFANTPIHIENKCCKANHKHKSKLSCYKEKAQIINTRDKQINQTEAQKNIRPQSETKEPKLSKQISFNPNGPTKFQNAGSHNQLSNHTLLWYDPQKQLQLRQSSKCVHHGISKQRKLLQLSSSAFYPKDYIQHIQRYTCCDDQKKIINSQKIQKKKKCQCQSQFCKCSVNQSYLKQSSSYPKIKTNQKQNNCECNQRACKCNYDCCCGSNCRCCPKFQVYDICKCDKGCKCGNNCQCYQKCACCPKYKEANQAVQLKKGNQTNICGCGPQCHYTTQCHCGSQCECSKNKKTLIQTKQKQTKVTLTNGAKKSKIIESNIRRSQPVFKSLTGRRR